MSEEHRMLRVTYSADESDPEGVDEVTYWQCREHGPACWMTRLVRHALLENNYGQTTPQQDGAAVDAIANMLRDPDWGVGMLEDIAELVSNTGRDMEPTIDKDGDPVSTWDRH